jgi:hypothetical protein
MSTFTPNGTVISQEAFASQYANWVSTTQSGISPPTVTIVVGATVTSIEANAFSQPTLNLSSATITFATPASSLTIGANAFAGLPISEIAISKNTTLLPHALSGINTLNTLNLTEVTTTLDTDSLDLTRNAVAPLLIHMPASSTVNYGQKAMVIPPTGIAAASGQEVTTTVSFSAVPSESTLANMFVISPTVTVPIKIAINYLTASTVTQDQIDALVKALMVGSLPPIAVEYGTYIVIGNLNRLSQFVASSINYVRVSTTECVVTGYNAKYVSNQLLPVPNKIANSNDDLNVVGVASSVMINGTRKTDTYFIIDNYYHAPYYANNNSAATPLFALVKSEGLSPAVVAPTLVCNGSYAISSDGQLVISAASNAYVQGYLAGATSASSLLNMNASLYDANSQTRIGTIASSATSFKITIRTLINNLDNDNISGGFQNLSTLKVVDFTNQANAGINAWNAYSSAASDAIIANSGLVSLISQINATPLVITQPNPAIAFPSVSQSIVNELSAASISNPNAAVTTLNVFNVKYNGVYVPYLTGATNSVSKFIADVLVASDATNAVQKPTHDAFIGFQTRFNLQVATLNAKIAALQPLAQSYFSSRFQLGNNTFKNCISLANIKSFANLRNLVKINQHAFNGCSSLIDIVSVPVNVETIGESAFRSSGISGLVLQDAMALRTIEAYAFYSCASLIGNLSFSSVLYNNAQHVETIGDYAFSNCTKLTDHIYFPLGLKSLGVGAFKGCVNLHGTVVFPQNPNFITIPASAFEGCVSLTGLATNNGTNIGLQYVPGSPNYVAGSANTIPDGLNIPSNVQSIGANAFKGCAAFTGALNLSPAWSALTELGASAFQGCSGFTSVKLPVNPLYSLISSNCFNGCVGLTRIDIPSNVLYILDGAFQGCVKLAGKLDVTNVLSIYHDAFNGCGQLSGALILGMNLSILGSRAFYGCPLLTSVTFLGIPPTNIKNTVTVFGLDVPNSNPFYVNVFQDNAWAPINAQGSSPLSINSVFRARDPVSGSTKSRVIMSFIDFTFAPLSSVTSRVLTLTKCDPATFLIWDNSGTGGVNTQLDPTNSGVKEWHDVYIPGLVKGFDLSSAQEAESATTLNILSNDNYNASAKKYVDGLLLAIGGVLRAALVAGSSLNGKNLLINAGPSGTGVDLVLLSSPVDVAPATNSYGVSSTGTGAAQVDTLSFGATSGAASVKAVSTGAHIQYYIAGSTSNSALNDKYAKKIITVDSLGVISIAPITVIESVVASEIDPLATSTGYTIQTTSNKLYLNDLVAPIGAYYVASVPGSAGATNFLKKILYVDAQSGIVLPETDATIVVSVANSAASNNVGTYSISGLTGAGNTDFVLNIGTGSAAVPAQSGTYYIKSSNNSIFNNTVVQVSIGGGMSLNANGLVGVAYTLSNLSTALVTESVPILATDAKFDRLQQFMNSEYASATSSSQQVMNALSDANGSLNTTMSDFTLMANNATHALLLPSSLQTKVASISGTQTTHNTALGDLNTYYSASYKSAKNALDSGFQSLLSIQSDSLKQIDLFIQTSIYDDANPAVANDLTHITNQLQSYMFQYLSYQKNNNQSWESTKSLVKTKLGYLTFSRVNKNLADEASRLISTWLATTTGGNDWSALTAIASTDSAIVSFISGTIVPANTANGTGPYQAFFNNHPAPTRAQVKSAIAAYESSMQTAGANAGNSDAASIAAATAYLAAYAGATINDKQAVSALSALVYGYYYATQYSGNFKTFFNALVVDFVAKVSAVLSKLVIENSAQGLTNLIKSLSDALNQEIVVANSNALDASNISNKHLNSAQIRRRLLELYNIVLVKKSGASAALPTFANVPAYENNWFNQRIDKYLNASISQTPPTTATATTAYNAAKGALLTKKSIMQTATIASYFAANPPSNDIVSTGGLSQSVIRDNVFNCLSNITTFVPVGKDLPGFISDVSNQFKLYVQNRDVAVGTTVGADRLAIIESYKQNKISETKVSLAAANVEYGMALYNMYAAIIDFAIVDMMGSASTAAIEFQTAMHKYKSSPIAHFATEYLPALQSAVFSQVYTSSIVTSPTVAYALLLSTASGAVSLYSIFNDSFTILSGVTNLTTVPIGTYSSTVGNTPTVLSMAEDQYAAKLIVVNIVDLAVALADMSIASEYNINAIDSIASPVDTQLTITAGLYTVSIGGWKYYGYEQSSLINNSLAQLSPNETAVFLYKGTGTNGIVQPSGLIAANNQTNNNTFFCDNAAYVIFIQGAGGSVSKTFSLYSYSPYGISSGSLKFTGTISSAGTIVTNIVAGCFQPQVGIAGVKLIGDLILSNAIKTIGINAFADCNAIDTLTFSSGSSSVDVKAGAFANCSELNAINLGSTIASVGRAAFMNCTGATSLTLSTNAAFTTVDHFAFLGCSNISNNVVIPSNVTQVNIQSFAGCSQMLCQQLKGESSYLPETFNKIGFGAFEGCSSLSGSLNLNNLRTGPNNSSSIQFIGSSAFFGCYGLTGTVSLPINASYRTILPYSFASASAPFAGTLISTAPNVLPMQLQGVVDFSNTFIATIGEKAFYNCASVSNLRLSSNIYDIGDSAFKLCIGLSKSLVLPARVKTVGNSAFEGCSGIAGLDIVSTTVSEVATTAWLSIGTSAFKDCVGLINSGSYAGIVIPNTVASLGDSAFSGCTNIPSVSVGSGLIAPGAFGKGVFVNCTKLAKVTLAFSFLARTGAGSVVAGSDDNTNLSFTGCTALGVTVGQLTPNGTIQIQSGTTGWTGQRAVFFNRLTIVINNKNIVFYMNEFNSNVTALSPTQEAILTQAVPLTDAQATLYVKASDLRKVFSVSTDSYLNPGGVDMGEMFFVSPEHVPFFNVANAQVVQGGIEAYNAAMYEQLIKDDVLRFHAQTIFGSADWTTMFQNAPEMKENMVASSGSIPSMPNGDVVSGTNSVNVGVYYNIQKLLKSVAYTTTNETNPLMMKSTYPPNAIEKWWGLTDSVTPEQGNICRKLFNLIKLMDPARINSMVRTGATPMNLPLLSGDQFVFVLKMNKKDVKLTLNSDSIPINERTYLIKLILTEDFVSGSFDFTEHNVALYSKSYLNKNVIPVDSALSADHVYSNYDVHIAVPEKQSSSGTATVVSHYSTITQNFAYEPVKPPQNLISIPGWYFPANAQATQLDFTPSAGLKYYDLRYLSAKLYFPNSWSSTTTLPSASNFPTWNVTFTNGVNTIVLTYYTKFLTTGGDVLNFLGQKVKFDYNNPHIQLMAPFEVSSTSMPNGQYSAFVALLNGADANGVPGVTNTISGTDIMYQTSNVNVVSGLRSSSETPSVGPFTYPSVRRSFQCISMPTNSANNGTAAPVAITAPGNAYTISKITLDINMQQNPGFVPSVIVKSAEVVAKNYNIFYLASPDSNA